MSRCVAFLFACLLSSLSIASACTAQVPEVIRFTLEPTRDGQVAVAFRHRKDDRDERGNLWNASFPSSQLVGLDVRTFRAGSAQPVRFALIREAGRLDCAGTAQNEIGHGNCRFTADPRFADYLASRDIARPSAEEAFAMMAIDVRRDVVEAIASARYTTPELDDLIALTAVGVDRQYIRDMAQSGYRPATIDTLVEFKALGITPAYIAQFARAGYANMDSDDIVQLRALAITPEFIAGFDRAGYRNLPVGKLVELKALGVTPEFALAVQRETAARPSVDALVERKIFGRNR